MTPTAQRRQEIRARLEAYDMSRDFTELANAFKEVSSHAVEDIRWLLDQLDEAERAKGEKS